MRFFSLFGLGYYLLGRKSNKTKISLPTPRLSFSPREFPFITLKKTSVNTHRSYKWCKTHVFLYRKTSVNENRSFGGVKLDLWGVKKRHEGGERNLPIRLLRPAFINQWSSIWYLRHPRLSIWSDIRLLTHWYEKIIGWKGRTRRMYSTDFSTEISYPTLCIQQIFFKD
jgi:hypothetical protein